jgi:hypothetical protein
MRLPPMINASTVKLERFVCGLGRGIREVNSLFTSRGGTQSNWSTCPHLGVVVCIGCSGGLIGGTESIKQVHDERFVFRGEFGRSGVFDDFEGFNQASPFFVRDGNRVDWVVETVIVFSG